LAGSLKAGDTLASIGLSFTTPATAFSNVGTYAIVPSITSTNYAFAGINGVLSITPRLLNITATSQTKVYGESDLPLTYNASGLVNGDLLTGEAARVAGENVGNYLIDKGTLAAGSNYDVTFTNADFTITPASLTIAANPQTKIYGEIDPSLSFSATGFKLSDKIDLITGSLSREAGKNVGKYAIDKGNLAVGDNYTLVFTENNFEITPRVLNVIAQAENKIYDGTTLAKTTFTDDRISGDELKIAGNANFENKNVGVSKAVNLSNVEVTGTDATNYKVSELSTTTSADITARALTISANAENKIYDGTTLAKTSFTDDRISGDELKIVGNADFENKNVGTAKTVKLSNVAVTGIDAENYDLSELPTTTNADITARALTISANAENKIYDGTTLAKTAFTDDRVSGDELKIAADANFENKNVGVAKKVNLSNVAVTGTDAANYQVGKLPTTTNADITARALTISAQAENKVYDGTTLAKTAFTDDRVSGDELKIAADANFENKNVGTAKAVKLSNVDVTGADAENYQVSKLPTTTSADITARALTIAAQAENKIYDGTTLAKTAFTDDRVSGDELKIAGNANFETKNVGIAKAVKLSNVAVTGTDAANYDLSELPTTTNADITARTLTISAQAENKVYDGTTLAKTAFTDDRVSGDELKIVGNADFENKNVGTAKTVKLSNVAVTGIDAENYDLSELPTTTNADITARALTISAQAENKIYDGTTLAKTNFTDDRIGGDELKIAGKADFENKNVGTAKTVKLSNVAVIGTDAANYQIGKLPTTTNADITARALTISAQAENKVYDGTILAKTTFTDDRVSGDELKIAGNANFETKNVGIAKTVKLSNVTVIGTDAANYQIGKLPTTTNADITARVLTISANAENKIYDGTTLAKTTFTDDRVSGDELKIAGNANFETKNVGVAKAVKLSNVAVTGSDAANYKVSELPKTTNADITARALTISANAENKIYDGTTLAKTAFTDDRVSGDELKIAGNANFETKNVGAAKTVKLSNVAVTGTDAANYKVSELPKTTNADITARALTISANAENKIYDGTTLAKTTFTDNRVSGDELKIAGNANFETKNVGTAKRVMLNNVAVTGTDAANYQVGELPTTTFADITARALTISANAENKIYDGTTLATTTFTDNRISGDELKIAGNANFETKNVGIAKAVKLSNVAVTGTDAANYKVSELPTTTSADITARALTISANAENKIYDGTTLAKTTFTDDRISGDELKIAGNANFETKNVGAAKAVKLSNVAVTGTDAANYQVGKLPTTTSADITARALTISANAENKIYDGTTLAKTTFIDDRISGDELKIAGNANFETKNVGAAKTVKLSNVAVTGTDVANYKVSKLPTATNADITPASLTISVEPKTKTYGDVDPLFTYNTSAFRGDDNKSLLVGSLARSDKSENVGKYLINGKFSAGENYLVTLIANNLDITPASLTVIANHKTKLLGTTDPHFDFIAQGLKLKDVVNNTITGSLLRDTGENVGHYSINQGSLTANPNYFLSYKAGSLEIKNNETSTTPDDTNVSNPEPVTPISELPVETASVITSSPSSLNTAAVEQAITAVFKDVTPQQVQIVTTSVATNVNSQTNTTLTMSLATPAMTTATASSASNIITPKAETTSSSGAEKSTLVSGANSSKEVKESKDEKTDKKDKKSDVIAVTTITDTKAISQLPQCK
jgi:hypothetical protein